MTGQRFLTGDRQPQQPAGPLAGAAAARARQGHAKARKRRRPCCVLHRGCHEVVSSAARRAECAVDAVLALWHIQLTSRPLGGAEQPAKHELHADVMPVGTARHSSNSRWMQSAH
eukprot:364709-Chlamydomonas_euryale.AAC.3